MTGKVTFESIDLPMDLPPEYNSFQKMGDNLVAIPSNWDGDTSKLVTIAGQPSTMEALQQQSLRLDIQKKQNELSGGGPASGYNGDFAATIDLASNQGGTNAQRAQIKTTLQNFIASKDYPSAYAAIQQATSAGLKGTAATTFQQQSNSLGVIDKFEAR